MPTPFFNEKMNFQNGSAAREALPAVDWLWPNGYNATCVTEET